MFRQEGQSLPAVAPFLLEDFGSAPVEIDDAGNVLWYGQWNDPDTTEHRGLFLNDTLLVQQGVTLIGGQLVKSVTPSTFELSSNGRWVIFEAYLAGDINGAIPDRPGSGLPAADDLLHGQADLDRRLQPELHHAGHAQRLGRLGLPCPVRPGARRQRGPVPVHDQRPYGRADQQRLRLAVHPDRTGPFRTPGTAAGGFSGVCNGSYDTDFNLYFDTQVADPNIAGATVDAQVWYRNPPNPGTANFSGAIHFLMCP